MIAGRKQKGQICMRMILLAALGWVAIDPAMAQAPAKDLVDLDGKAVNPFQHPNGKVIVFLFVRTDCPISNRYAPTIQELSKEYKKSAEFFLVYPVKSETAEEIRSHLLEFGYKLRALRDPDGELVKAAQTRVTPEAAVFRADGRLLYHGRIDDWYAEFGKARSAPTTHELSATLESSVTGKPIAVATMPAVGCFLPDVK